MFFRRIHYSKILAIAAISLVTLPIFSSENTTEDRVKSLIKNVLKEQGRTLYQIPTSLEAEYEVALEGATISLNTFLSIMETIVLSPEIKKAVDAAIDARFSEYNLTTLNIALSLQKDFKNRRDAVISDAKHSMQVYGNEYITKVEIEDLVALHMDYGFIQEIKKTAAAASFWENVGAVVSSVANKIKELKPTTSTTMTIYYSHMCPICQEDFATGERVGVLSCGHCFHPECIKQALAIKKECPVCRAQNVFLAKIYDTKEQVPGYYPTPDAPAAEKDIFIADSLRTEQTPAYNPEIFEPSAPDFPG